MSKEWSKWYVIHSYRRGQPRLYKKPTGHEVEGGAGSVSNQVPTSYYETDRIDNRNVIRFPISWVKNNKEFLDRHFSLKEYSDKIWKENNPNQEGLGRYFD